MLYCWDDTNHDWTACQDVDDYINASSTTINLLCSNGQIAKSDGSGWSCATDATGGGGATDYLGQIGDVSTSSPMTYGEVIIYNTATPGWESVATSTLGLGGSAGTVSSVAMSVPTGLTITGSPITTSGTLALTYTGGYAAVKTASTTNWNTFYDTPSNRITDGTNLAWSGNTLNATDTNTNANTICAGGTTYLDGEGNCDDISGVYVQAADWTTIDSYPSACAAGGGVVTGLGDTLTCTATSSLGLVTIGGAFHDGFSDFVANEHLDWTQNVGTVHAGNYTDTNTQLGGEEVDDFVNALLKDADSVNTRITLTYDDVNNAFDFVVDDMNDDVPDAGDFGNAVDLDANGNVAWGNITAGELADNTVQAADIDTIACGTNCTWDATNDEIDVDDVFLINSGSDIAGAGSGFTWGFNASAGSDPVMTFGDGIINVTTGALQVSGAAVQTGADLVDDAIASCANANACTLTADAITDNLILLADFAHSQDYGDFTMGAGESFTLDTGTVADNEIDYANVTLADFDYQTAWRVFYSNTDGDVTELALGADNTYLKSNGAAVAPTFEAIAAGGDITDVFNCSTGDCNTMTVGTSEYLTYGTGYIDANRFAGVTTVSGTEFGYLNNVSSAIQTQLNAKVATADMDTLAELNAIVTGETIASTTNVWADAYVNNDITIDLATLATTLTITDNENTAENNAILFTSGGALTGGNLGIESDGNLYYTPSTGKLNSTTFLAGTSYSIGDATVLEAELEIIDGATCNTTQLNYINSLSSNAQTQLDSKSASFSTLTVLNTLIGETIASTTHEWADSYITSAATWNAKWDALSDMILTDNYIYVGDASNDPVGVAMSNDCTIASNGAITCDHDALDNFVEAEHYNWTNDLGAVNIHTGNYPITDSEVPNNITIDLATLASTITVADESADTSCYLGYYTGASGSLAAKTGTNLTFNSSTGLLTATGFAGALTGNVTGDCSGSSGTCTGLAATATALAGNGANCSAGSYALGVDASGAVEGCTDATTEINSVVNGLGGTNLTCSAQNCNVDDAFMTKTGAKIWSTTIASTSPAFISSGLLPIPPIANGYTITHIECRVYGGTNKIIAIEDASGNSTENITCLATVTDDDGSITNATYTASEISYIDFGSGTGSVDYVMISVFGTY